jgi:hypothetical protein
LSAADDVPLVPFSGSCASTGAVLFLDGHDVAFLRELRASSAFARTPAVLWTALALGPDAIAALEQEFAPLAVVQKPRMMPELPDAIRSLLAGRHDES